jgi:hypothetical protein
MKYVKLGHTGLDVSRICLRCMSYGDAGPNLVRSYVAPHHPDRGAAHSVPPIQQVAQSRRPHPGPGFRDRPRLFALRVGLFVGQVGIEPTAKGI